MTVDKSLLDRLRDRGEEVLTQVSGELMSNPRFMKAMERALRGKEKVEEAAAHAIKSMNIPTRTEFKKALSRIDALEREVQTLRSKAKTSGGGPRKAPVRKGRAKKTPASRSKRTG